MSEFRLIPAKATAPDEQSDGIVVSFGSEWHEHVLAQKFNIVIRKRVPKSPSFRWLYFHINSPFSAICARAPIEKIFTASLTEVLSLASRIHLKADEIKSYLAGSSSIGCYQLGTFQFPSSPVTAVDLALRMVYHPPQSFFIISNQAKAIIDEMAGFPSAIKSRSSKKVIG